MYPGPTSFRSRLCSGSCLLGNGTGQVVCYRHKKKQQAMGGTLECLTATTRPESSRPMAATGI
jgi:hypothetical protein